MEKKALVEYVKYCEQLYLDFMGIKQLPNYRILEKTLQLDLNGESNIYAVASSKYSVSTDTHDLLLYSNFPQPTEHILFHEFTHIWDAETYTKRDPKRSLINIGYTGFHAAQVELMKILNADSIQGTPSFSIDQIVDTYYGKMTVDSYIRRAYLTASERIRKKTFPENMEDLLTVIELIFNYLGRRSICKMFAFDYQDVEDDPAISVFIGGDYRWEYLKSLMACWLDDTAILKIDNFCRNLIAPYLSQMLIYPSLLV